VRAPLGKAKKMPRNLIFSVSAAGLVLAALGLMETASSSPKQASTPRLRPYFPTTEFRDLTSDAILVPSFEKHLAELAEPVLYDLPGVHYAVRVTWMTPFYGDAVLRIEDAGGRVRFVYKRRPSIAAPDTKKDVDLRGELTREALTKLTSNIDTEGFFALTNQQNVVATDGTIWLLEVYDGSRYHAVYRVGPFSTPVQNIGRLAATLAGIQEKQLE
jgi:hypothetical protein